MVNFYDLLGVKINATEEEIQKAYEEIIKKCDITVEKYEKTESKIIKSLDGAKEVLLNEEKRTSYNSTLKEIIKSKQFSKNKNETYKSKIGIYKSKYGDINITKWELFVNYIIINKDNIVKKFLKSILIILNLLLFIIIKGICNGLLFIINIFGKFTDVIISILLLIGVISLFTLEYTTPDYIPLIPANIESFCIFSILSFFIKTIKVFVVDKSNNIYALVDNYESKIFMKILDI